MFTFRSYGGTSSTGSPSSRMWPSVGTSKPASMRSVVVLPHPDGPSRLKNSPFGIARSMLSTAVKSPNRFVTPSIVIASDTYPLSCPVSTLMPLSLRPKNLGIRTAAMTAVIETTIMSVPIALIVGETPKRIADQMRTGSG